MEGSGVTFPSPGTFFRSRIAHLQDTELKGPSGSGGCLELLQWSDTFLQAPTSHLGAAVLLSPSQAAAFLGTLSLHTVDARDMLTRQQWLATAEAAASGPALLN